MRRSTRPTCPSKAGYYGYLPDGSGIVRSMFDTISIESPATGEVVRRFSLAPRSFVALVPAVSPDGRWIAFGGDSSGVPFLGVVSADGSRLHRLADWVDRGTVAWSARGDAIYFFRRVLGGVDFMKVRIDLVSGRPIGPPVLVMDRVPFYAHQCRPGRADAGVHAPCQLG